MSTNEEPCITVIRGSVVEQDTTLVVNANNCRMRGGSGINGAFHTACGPTLMEELKRQAPMGAPPAQVVCTSAPGINALGILHVAGPVYVDDSRVPKADTLITLYHAYYNCLEYALKFGAKSISFPSISTGIYGVPVTLGAVSAFEAVTTFLTNLKEAGTTHNLEEIRFVLFGEQEHKVFLETLLSYFCENCGELLEAKERVLGIASACPTCKDVVTEG
jgi:O-acetyl-ADP-ribose deacetylase (regulator of RNase III)